MDVKILKQSQLDNLYEPYKKCLECPLGFLGRKNVVFGYGNPDAKIMLVGEGPGKDEDEQGLPFIGRSGKLLTRALSLVSIERSEVFITNIVKCRPPNNRAPLPNEAATCTTLLLEKQIKIIKPKIICTLGSIALNYITKNKHKITQIHGKIIEQDDLKIIPIFHPAYILRNQSKEKIWLEDLKLIKELANNSD